MKMIGKNMGFLIVLMSLFCGCEVLDQSENKETMQSDYFSEEISVKRPMASKEINAIPLSQNQKSLAKGYNEFAMDLLDSFYVSEDKNSSFVISPLSIYMDLAMAANGTSGKAREEILKAFKLDEEISQLNTFCQTVIEGLPAVDLSTTVRMANALIVDSYYPVKKSFQKEMEDVFYGVAESLPFKEWDLVTSRINNWVNDCTEGLIPTILDRYEEAPFAYLLNATYFKADMVYPFDPELTADRDFHSPEGDISIPFMAGDFEIRYESNEVYSAISLPLGNSKFCLSVYLPQAERDIAEVITRMKESSGFSSETKDVVVVMPKFETRSSLEALPVLKKMGISYIFDPCDFQNMLEYSLPLMIGSVQHKASICVNEKGVVAAAVTSSGIWGSSTLDRPTYYFTADHPFVYLIQERSSDVVLFSGVFTGK